MFNTSFCIAFKGAKTPPPPQMPTLPGKPASTISGENARDPNKKKNRGFGSTILTTGLSDSNTTYSSILGG